MSFGTRLLIAAAIMAAAFSCLKATSLAHDDVAPQIMACAEPSVVRVASAGGMGSGTAIEGGWVLTAQHVVGAAEHVAIALADEEWLPAWVANADAGADLALVGIGIDLPPLAVGPAARWPIGSAVFALGYPLALDGRPSITAGVLSGIRGGDGRPPTSGPARSSDRVLVQTDAAVSPGHSGGPLLDRDCGVMGVVVAKYGGWAEGMGLAVAGETVLEFLAVAEKERTWRAQGGP